jgi:Ca-activated chloride channel homolog
MLSQPLVSPSSPSAERPFAATGGVLVSLDGRVLPLRGAALHGDCRAGVGRITLEQRFVNPHPEPLRVTLTVPMPVDAAVAGFSFLIDDREVVGRVTERKRARERFEQAIARGHTAALFEQERASVFTQEVGNVPAGATVVVRLSIDQRLKWIDGAWEWRFPTVVAPRYLGEPGRVPDADRIGVQLVEAPVPVQMALSLVVRDEIADPGPSSPSHALQIDSGGAHPEIGFAREMAGLDRDVVVRWPVARAEPGLALDVARPPATHARVDDAFGLLTLVPPRLDARAQPVARDLIVLLDTSGSMHGAPLDQAKRLAGALVDSLSDGDRFELIEFSTKARRFARKPLPATGRKKAEAIAWVDGLRAGGGTEMRTGLLEALAGLRPEAQRQIVLVSDGLIGFEEEIVAAIQTRLPAGSRVHTVGVGSAVNRALTGPAARAGRGEEVVIGVDEDPEPAIERLLARTAAPLVVDLQIEGDALLEQAPLRLPDLFAGAPAMCSLRLRPEGGRLRVRGRTEEGFWVRELVVPTAVVGFGSSAVVSLFGRERVEDLETQRATGAGVVAVDREIETLGLAFQIATRLTSWLAETDAPMVDPRDPSRRETVPQALPHGMSVAGLGLRAPMRAEGFVAVAAAPAGPPPSMPSMLRSRVAGPASSGGRPPSPTDASFEMEAMRDEAPEEASAFDDEAFASSEALPKPRAPRLARREARSHRVLTGRIVLADANGLLVEVRIDGDALDWRSPSRAVLERDDGSKLEVAIVADRTTRDGLIAAGAVLRIGLQGVQDGISSFTRLRIDDGSGTIEVRLHP